MRTVWVIDPRLNLARPSDGGRDELGFTVRDAQAGEVDCPTALGSSSRDLSGGLAVALARPSTTTPPDAYPFLVYIRESPPFIPRTVHERQRAAFGLEERRRLRRLNAVLFRQLSSVRQRDVRPRAAVSDATAAAPARVLDWLRCSFRGSTRVPEGSTFARAQSLSRWPARRAAAVRARHVA